MHVGQQSGCSDNDSDIKIPSCSDRKPLDSPRFLMDGLGTKQEFGSNGLELTCHHPCFLKYCSGICKIARFSDHGQIPSIEVDKHHDGSPSKPMDVTSVEFKLNAISNDSFSTFQWRTETKLVTVPCRS